MGQNHCVGYQEESKGFHKSLGKSLAGIKHSNTYTEKEKTVEFLSTYFRPSHMSESIQRPGSMNTQESQREGVGWEAGRD